MAFTLTASPNSAQIAAVKTKPLLREPSALSTARWTSYAIAAGATAVTGMPTAEAEIHYSGLINFKFESRLSETHRFPLSQGAVLVGFRDEVGFYEHSASFSIKGAAVSNELREYPLSYFSTFLAAALPRGSVVSQGYFQRFGFGRLQYYDCGFPNWVEPGTHAIGFRFNSGRGMQYGWVRIKFAGCGSGDNKFIVQDYAWGDPGDKIKTGQTQLHEDETQVTPQAAKSDDAAPVDAGTQGSLGLLALGAVGVQAWRRSRRANQ
jgi:hypothetical protein